MSENEDELVVSLPVMDSSPPNKGGFKSKLKNSLGTIRLIWYELTAGVGAWGSLKPLLAALLALIPFLFIGQHFNREHQKAFDWMMLQVPLLLTLVLFPILWIWSIFDAYRIAMIDVTMNENEKRVLEAL
ncbi:MAG: hypothetical protein QF440_05515 [Candidatus Thalassarchaeaceae archaeon]|nr:hypothetical protein [Candidatus Thalassarchaeaceae archaeon]